MRERPAGRGGAEPEPGLQREGVHLVDDAVDVIAERRALRLDLGVMGQHVRRAVAEPGQRVGLEAERAQPVDRAHLGVGQRRGELSPGIGEEAERPGAGDRGIELPERARRRVSGIGEGLGARGLLPVVERGEIGVAHVDLATDLEHLGRAFQLGRDVVDRAGVCGHVLARLPVAAGRRLQQRAALVAQRKAEPVDLGLGSEAQVRIGGKVQVAPDAVVEIANLALFEGVAEREHPHRMPDLREPFGGGRAHHLARAVGALEGGKARLDLGVAPFQRVVLGVGDVRRIRAMVGDVRPGEQLCQPRQFLARLCLAKFPDRHQIRHRLPLLSPAASPHVPGK